MYVRLIGELKKIKKTAINERIFIEAGIGKILQGSVVTKTVLGGLTMHRPVANFL